VSLVVTIGAEGNSILNAIVPRNDMMHLHPVEAAAYATPATAVYEKLLYFSLVKTHGNLLVLLTLNNVYTSCCIKTKYTNFVV